MVGPEKASQALSEWTKVVKKGTKAITPLSQLEVAPLKKQQHKPQQEQHKWEQLQQWKQ